MVIFSALNATIIYPATEDHIKKHSRELSIFIDETATMYQEVTAPYIKHKASVGNKQVIQVQYKSVQDPSTSMHFCKLMIY